MKIWSVNTNISNFNNNELGATIVIKQNRIVTWYRNDLNQINKGDLILSYNNNKTIIAVGYALSDVQNYDNEPHQQKTDEQWIYVDWILKCQDNPIKLNDIENDFKVAMFNGIVFSWADHIDTFKLLAEIGKRKI